MSKLDFDLNLNVLTQDQLKKEAFEILKDTKYDCLNQLEDAVENIENVYEILNLHSKSNDIEDALSEASEHILQAIDIISKTKVRNIYK